MYAAEVVGWRGEQVDVKFAADRSVQSVPRKWLQRTPENFTDKSLLAIGDALAGAGLSFDDRDSGPFSELRVAVRSLMLSFDSRTSLELMMRVRVPADRDRPLVRVVSALSAVRESHLGEPDADSDRGAER
eukprot:29749-Rhodomonas_salina.1